MHFSRMTVCLICLFLLLTPPALASVDLPLVILAGQGSGTEVAPLQVPDISAQIDVDGRLQESAWERALVIDLPYEIEPTDNEPAPRRTECLLLAGDSEIYIAFRAWDPEPDLIRAHFCERDRMHGEDKVNVYFDTFNDGRGGYRFACNPLGVQADTKIDHPAGYGTNGWDAIWDSAGRITDWGYVVEMAIPFSQLRFKDLDGAPQIWGFDAKRDWTRSIQHTTAALPADRDDNCYLCRLVKIQGMGGADPGRNIEISPTMTAVRNDALSQFPDGDMERESDDADAGLSVSWGITPTLNFNGTINPDFSQVEADAYRLNINQPFALWFQEKRPFFTEGAEFFNTVMTAVYTRSMRDPAWGAKLTGKEGEHSIGALTVRDDLTNIVFAGPRGSGMVSLDSPNTTSAFRYQRTFGSRYSVGAIFTDREGEEYYNRLGGFDGEFRVSNRDRFRIQYLASRTAYPEQTAIDFGQPLDELKSTALDIFYHHERRNFSLDVNYTDIGTDFRADTGFIPQVGYRYCNFTGHLSKRPKPGDWFSWLALNGSYQYTEDQGGELINKGYSFWGGYWGPRESRLYFVVGDRTRTYNGEEFDVTTFNFEPGIRVAPWLMLNLNCFHGDRIDYGNTRLGKTTSLSPDLEISAGRHLNLSLSHTWEKMNVDDERLYEANISQATIKYRFSRRMLLRTILQYASTDFGDGSAERQKELFTQALFSYELNPQTKLYLGYSDNSYGDADVTLTRNDRMFFMKLGYAFMY
ncbi:MAG: carbohydrate binding family 9 domain-containing protein [bacterium]|nr:carbohydrate binding family 9 domain-containing protein [bacterium]